MGEKTGPRHRHFKLRFSESAQEWPQDILCQRLAQFGDDIIFLFSFKLAAS